jgi:hypothetical protein
MEKDNYIIVKDNNLLSLKTSVNRFLDDGYIPTGNITVYNDLDGNNTWFLQSMIYDEVLYGEKDEDDDDSFDPNDLFNS